MYISGSKGIASIFWQFYCDYITAFYVQIIYVIIYVLTKELFLWLISPKKQNEIHFGKVTSFYDSNMLIPVVLKITSVCIFKDFNKFSWFNKEAE